MKFYKCTPKNLIIDGLVLGLCAFSIYKSKNALEGNIGLSELYWGTLAGGILLIRWSHLSWCYFYGKNANQNPSLLFKIHKVWVTSVGVAAISMYFVFIFIFLR